jgi:hypothetical protein
MDPSDVRSEERRRCFRFDVDELWGSAALAIAGETIEGCLIDHSAGGFGMLVLPARAFQADELAWLRTATGTCQVRIASVIADVEIQAGEEQVEALQSLPPGPFVRLGLERLQDVTEGEDGASRYGWLERMVPFGRHASPHGMGMGLLLFVALMMAVPLGGGYAAILAARHYLPDGKNAAASGPAQPTSAGQATPDKSAAPAAEQHKDVPAASDETVAEVEMPDVAPSLPSTERFVVPASVRRLPTAVASLVPEVSRWLALTESQRAEIHRIVNSTGEALDHMEIESLDLSRTERSRQRAEAWDKAREQVQTLLTPEQRARWEKFSPEQRSAK